MNKRKLLLLPLFMLVLAGCKDDPSSSISQPPVSDSSSEEGPSIPSTTVPDIEHKTIAEIRAMTADGATATTAQKELQYETTGIVTAKFRGANIDNVGPAWNIAIQDGDHALLLYAITVENYEENFKDIPVGSELTVTGYLAAYGGLRELDGIKYVSHKAATAVTPEVLESIAQTSLAGKDSKLVKIEGLKLTEAPEFEAEMDGNRSNITLNMTLALAEGDDTISTYMHYNIPMADAQATMAKLKDVTSNSVLSWTGILGMNRGNFQMTNANADEWEVVLGDAPVLEGIAFDPDEIELSLEEEYESKLVATPFDGPLTGLTYESSDVDVVTVDEEGVLVAVGAGTAEVTATVGTFEATLDVTVLGEVSTDITLSVESLGLTGVAYDDSDFKGDTAKEVAGVKFGVFGVADYGNGLQWRQKSNSALWNETEFEGAIASITVNYNTDQDYPGKVGIYTSEDTAVSAHQTAEPEAILGDGSTEFTVTVDFDEADAIHFFRLQYPVSGHTYTVYISSIVITFHGEEVVEADSYSLTTTSLDISGVAYDDSDFKGDTAKEVAGVKFGVFGVADYGNGLQWRQKSNSALWNETEFEGAIASITVNYNTAQDYPGKVGIYTSEDTAVSAHQTAEPEAILGDGSTEFTVTVDFDEADAIHFFRLQYPVSGYTYSNYISEIVVTLHPAA